MNDHSEPLLEVRGLSKHYVRRHRLSRAKLRIQAFEDVNLSIDRGTTVALVGESGAGKSSLARCIALLERPMAGEIWYEGDNLLDFSQEKLVPIRREIQLIFQDPTSALNPGLTATEIVAEPLLIGREGTRSERRERALELMEQVGLPPAWGRKFPLEFSGGQRQRLAIARAMALRPKLLILDEALSNLDLANRQMMLSLLRELQAAHSLTYIHISHDLRLVSRIADEVAVMHGGSVVEKKPVMELFENPEHPYTRELLGAMPSEIDLCASSCAG